MNFSEIVRAEAIAQGLAAILIRPYFRHPRDIETYLVNAFPKYPLPPDEVLERVLHSYNQLKEFDRKKQDAEKTLMLAALKSFERGE